MRLPSSKALAGIIPPVGALMLGLMLLSRGPHDVTLVLKAPEATCSSGLFVIVLKGTERVVRAENVVGEMEKKFPDRRVQESRLTVRLTSGTYRVLAAYDRLALGSELPLDQVINVSRSGTILLQLPGFEQGGTGCR